MITAMKKHLAELNFPPAQTVSKAHDAVRSPIPLCTPFQLADSSAPLIGFRILDDFLRYTYWSEIDLAFLHAPP